jgi:glycosyltransferase involved in cell wall biosynthesis
MTLSAWPPDIHVLAPAYKAEKELRAFLPRLAAAVPVRNITVVDDGSGDGTADACRSLGIECLSHDSNRGKGAALVTGFDFLLGKNAQWIITMDSDGQHAAEDLGGFLEAIRRRPGAGIIIGKRTMKPGLMPLPRIISNRLTSWVLGMLCGMKIDDSQCGYRAYSAALLHAVRPRFKRFEMESEMILRACRLDFPVHFIAVQTLYLKVPSHISHALDTIRWIRAMAVVAAELRQRRQR